MSAILEEGIGFGGNDSSSTDVIISKYENWLNSSIANKTLIASKNGIIPQFTSEELAYLNKKAIISDPTSEVKVITPTPTITLKKGNTEINIKNATTLFKKMEEIYPNGLSKDQSENIARQPFIKASIEHGLKNDINEEETDIVKNSIPQPENKTVNKNAYEIRTDVLSMALSWVRYKKDCNPTHSPFSDEDVLITAQKFYKFVENRR